LIFSSPHTNRSLLYILEFGFFSQTLYCINIFVNNRDQGFATFFTHGYSVGVFVSYCYQPQNQQFLLFSSSLLCAPETGQTGLECFVIGCFHNACKHKGSRGVEFI
jgi:hypothetical protein